MDSTAIPFDAASAAGPPPQSSPRLIITSHATSGASVFGSDSQVPLFAPIGPTGSSFSVFDIREAVPVNNSKNAKSHAKVVPRCPPQGTLFCITNIPPKFTVPMHRTLSLDYCIILGGEIVLRLDSGEEKSVKAGEFIIQAGSNHQWINKTTESCRIAFVMVGAEKLKLDDGTELESINPKRP
ncbi:Cupin-domain-containing oxidoreductase virC [Paramyrothecium foliicola]|nr:Cupin-domain-containing oxidoreductase virC [Paramyrothecium foliicola]